jgi:hypothetical protein
VLSMDGLVNDEFWKVWRTTPRHHSPERMLAQSDLRQLPAEPGTGPETEVVWGSVGDVIADSDGKR